MSEPAIAAADRESLSDKLPGLLKDAGITALIGLALTLTMVGIQLTNVQTGLELTFRPVEVALSVLMIFIGKLALNFAREGYPLGTGILGIALPVLLGLAPGAVLPDIAYEVKFLAWLVGGVLIFRAVFTFVQQRQSEPKPPGHFMDNLAKWTEVNRTVISLIGLAVAVAIPFLFPVRSTIDLATLVLLYIMLGWGLNIVVGLAGLLDLGYVAFYAVGAYAFAILAREFGVSFWICLPLAAILAAFAGLILGFPVLRLRGDYFAIVTLGFGEIIRIVLENWSDFTGGPDGIRSIPDPSFFGIAAFTPEQVEGGLIPFHELFGMEYTPLQRVIFLYYLILVLAILVNVVSIRLRNLPLGRAWEALREDDIACQSLGINRRNIKLAAFVISAAFGGIAGAFFATRQGFISPESFKFIESAVILAIVVLGGMGSQIGIVLAAILLIGGPEWAREAEEYRMLIFGAGMVMIMIWRPRGLLAHREPSVLMSKFLGRRNGVPPDYRPGDSPPSPNAGGAAQ